MGKYLSSSSNLIHALFKGDDLKRGDLFDGIRSGTVFISNAKTRREKKS